MDPLLEHNRYTTAPESGKLGAAGDGKAAMQTGSRYIALGTRSLGLCH